MTIERVSDLGKHRDSVGELGKPVRARGTLRIRWVSSLCFAGANGESHRVDLVEPGLPESDACGVEGDDAPCPLRPSTLRAVQLCGVCSLAA